VEAWLRGVGDTDRSLSRQIQELLELMRQYGPEDVAGAIEKAAAARAFGCPRFSQALLLPHKLAKLIEFTGRSTRIYGFLRARDALVKVSRRIGRNDSQCGIH
jgi:hypothetical protein